MADENTQPLTDEEKATLAALTQRQAAAQAAEKAAADEALRALVSSADFKSALAAMHTAISAKPLEVDLTYAVMCMDRLVERYPALT